MTYSPTNWTADSYRAWETKISQLPFGTEFKDAVGRRFYPMTETNITGYVFNVDTGAKIHLSEIQEA